MWSQETAGQYRQALHTLTAINKALGPKRVADRNDVAGRMLAGLRAQSGNVFIGNEPVTAVPGLLQQAEDLAWALGVRVSRAPAPGDW